VLNNAYVHLQWNELKPLLAALHGNTSQNFAWALNYYEKFIRVLFKLITDDN